MSLLEALVDGVDTLAGFLGELGIRIARKHLVEINLRALPFAMPFIVAGDVITAAGLLGLERVHLFLRLLNPLVGRMERGEIGESGDGLSGNALIVFRLLGLFEVSVASHVQRIHTFLAVSVTVGSAFVGAGSLGIIGHHFLLVGGAEDRKSVV